ncbi:hypothetical protein HG530_008606 [Fusarium avenaceum]|nr:hypothetical protein HG530_008606 [Fusarium avenaceum]
MYWLSAGLEAGGDVAAGNALALGEVGEERKKIALEVALVLGSDERVHSGVAVGTSEELPLSTVDGEGGKRGGSVVGDRSGTAVDTDPDHDLVLVVGANRGSEPEIVRNIRDHVGTGVSPRPLCRDGLDGRDLLVDVLKSDVGVGLYVDVAASPAPFGGPGERTALVRVEGGALRSRGSLTTAPVVVVDGVSSSLDRAESVTPGGGTLVEGLGGSGRRGRGHSQESRDDTKELHDDRW